MKKILMIVTNHGTLGDTDQANGTYAPELTHVVDVIVKAGFNYDIASIAGGAAPLYGTDVEGDAVNQQVLEDGEFQTRIRNTLVLGQLSHQDYDGVFYPGGFGLLSDLATDANAAKLTAAHYENDGVIAAVCHGPAALLPIKLANGESLLASKSVTGFTREEEIDFGTIGDIPFLLEESLTRQSCKYSKMQPWQDHVVVDGRVITGQNPASAHGVGLALVEAVNAK